MPKPKPLVIDLHAEAEASCNNPYTEKTWLITFLRTFGIGRPPTPINQKIFFFLWPYGKDLLPQAGTKFSIVEEA
jgi:hypothetical protein